MMNSYKVAETSQTLALANTEYEVSIGRGWQDVLIRLDDTGETWRFSNKAGVVAGGGGFPKAAGEELSFRGPCEPQILYVAVASPAQTLRKAYAHPAVR